MNKTNTTLGGGGFHHVAIRSGDFEKSVGFYTRVLGFKKKIQWGDAPKRAIMLDTGDGNYLEIFERVGQPRGTDEGQILHLCFRCDDVDGVIANIREAGCEITIEPKDVTIAADVGPVPIRIAFFAGPDGEIVELFKNEIT